MGKIRYTVRLYRLHDMDLITFIFTRKFDVMRAIYSSITAFAKGEVFVVEIPPSTGAELPQLRRVYTKALILDEEKDKKTIDMINRIQPGRRNNFFKNLLRIYLACPFSEDFFEKPSDVAWFEEKIKIFRTGRRVVKAGKVRQKEYDGAEERQEYALEAEVTSATKRTPKKEEETSAKGINEPMAEQLPEYSIDEAEAIVDLFESLGGEA